MSFIYLVCALRTNLGFVVIFLGLMLTFCFLSGAFWQLAEGNEALGNRLVVGGGACGFVATASGWYLFAGILLDSLHFPFSLPGQCFRSPCGGHRRDFINVNLQWVTYLTSSRPRTSQKFEQRNKSTCHWGYFEVGISKFG